jgi:hypothetical protein
MSARTIIMTLVLICLAAMLLIGRLRGRTRIRHVRHQRTSSLLHRIDRSVHDLDRLAPRDLERGRRRAARPAGAAGARLRLSGPRGG